MFRKTIIAALLACSLATPALATQTLEVVSGPNGKRALSLSFLGAVGQSFTAETNSVSSIGFQFLTLNPSRANSPLTLSLFKGQTLTGTSLFTTSFILPDSITSRDTVEWVDIALPDVALSLGGFYTAVLNASSSRAALAIGPEYDYSIGDYVGGDAYKGGRLINYSRNLGAVCEGETNICDANFRVTGDVTSAVPEPTSWALLVLGFGLVGGAMRRRTPRTRLAFA